jgi:hypothetical protein
VPKIWRAKWALDIWREMAEVNTVSGVAPLACAKPNVHAACRGSIVALCGYKPNVLFMSLLHLHVLAFDFQPEFNFKLMQTCR